MLALAFAVIVFGVRDGLRGTMAWIEGLGAWWPVLFVPIHIAATVLFPPGSILALGAGAPFGVGWGSVIVSAGSLSSAQVPSVAKWRSASRASFRR